ncbi:hypothetical protein MLD38_031265 [Melastoma candidum]|uniref:Uncharacterized protein n=1 Tax=Melastoma candidum TaxID=119954 RepID=A0ACB9MQF0_9MYRT|nr:hypothetical protein MLD38_031265 [Melastoma candidum]
MQSYWASIVPLPLEVCSRIDRLMASFLWGGSDLGYGKAKVKWMEVCCPIKEGGLGIKRPLEWNRVALLKHIWQLLADTSGSLWTIWVHKELLKSRSIWSIQPRTHHSWLWKRILKVRGLMENLIAWKVGDGSRISFWHDKWAAAGRLDLIFSSESRVNSCIPKEATIKAVFQSIAWGQFIDGVLPEGEGKQFFKELIQLLKPTDYPGTGADRLLWSASSNGIFSIKEAWELLRVKRQKVRWSKWIWSNAIPPRCSFLVWLIAKGKLRTAQFWHLKGLWTSAECVLCQGAEETRDHLFFECAFARQV